MNTQKTVIPLPWQLTDEEAENVSNALSDILLRLIKYDLTPIENMSLLLKVAYAFVGDMYIKYAPDEVVKRVVRRICECLAKYPDHVKESTAIARQLADNILDRNFPEGAKEETL